MTKEQEPKSILDFEIYIPPIDIPPIEISELDLEIDLEAAAKRFRGEK